MSNLISVTIGDSDGIGIEILFNLWKKNKIKNFILFTNYKIIENYCKKNKIKVKILNKKTILNIKKLDNKFLYIFDYKVKNKYDNTYKALKYSYKYTKLKIFIGVITLPLNKELIINNINKKFLGQTEFYQKIDKRKKSNMMFIHKDLIFLTLTNHIKIGSVSKKILNKKNIFEKINILNDTLIKDFKIKKPKIVISGLNPHSGENGRFGNEEILSLIPTIVKLRKKNINIIGPISGDSLITNNNIKKFNCFIFNYHDQALIPFKMLSKYSGINFTGGLSILRVSPDHGTAYDLVGKNVANNSSLLNCFNLITKISKNRN